jgi:hypothetical protein
MSQYRSLKVLCHAWLAEQIAFGDPEVEALILIHCFDLDDSSGVWSWELLLAARKRWLAIAPPDTFGRWLRQNERDILGEASLTFLDDQRRLIGLTEILAVR